MAENDAAAERIADLEIRLAHFEHQADELSDIAARQGREIDRLTARLDAMQRRLQDMAEALERVTADGKPPPHY